MFHRRRRVLGGTWTDPDGARITSHPAIFIGDDGDNAVFTVTATSGNGSSLSYQWQEYSGGSWSDLGGEVADTLTIATISGSDYGRTFRVVVSNSATSVESGPAQILSSDVTITSEPVSFSDFEGEDAVFTVLATSGDNSPLTYQWQENTGSWVNLSDTGSISGSDTNELSVSPVVIGDDGRQFRCLVSNTGDTKTSATVTMTVANGGLVVTLNPVTQTVTEFEVARLSCFATSNNGSETFYQWQVNTGSGWGNVATGGTHLQVNSDELVIDTVLYPEDDGSIYRCRIDNSVDTKYTATATLTVTEVVFPDDVIHENGSKLFSERDEQIVTEVAA